MKYFTYAIFYASVLYGFVLLLTKLPFFEGGDPAIALALTALTIAFWNGLSKEDKGGE